MRKAKRYDRNTHDPTAGLCYPWIFLLALTHLTLSSLPTRLFPVTRHHSLRSFGGAGPRRV